MDKGKLKGHAALWVANLVWGLNAPIGKSVLWSESNPGGVSPFALSVYRMLGACLLFWSVSFFLPRERVARRDIVLLLFASVFGIQLNQMLFLWGLSLTSPIDSSIIATVVPVLTMRRGAAADSGQPARDGAHEQRQGRRIVSRQRGQLRHLPHRFPQRNRQIFARNDHEVDVPLRGRRRCRGLLPAAHGIGYVVVCSTFLSYFMVPIGQRYLRPTVVSMYNYVQPVVAVLFSVAIGLDSFGFTKAAAALCVFAGVWLVTKSKSRAQVEAEAGMKKG